MLCVLSSSAQVVLDSPARTSDISYIPTGRLLSLFPLFYNAFRSGNDSSRTSSLLLAPPDACSAFLDFVYLSYFSYIIITNFDQVLTRKGYTNITDVSFNNTPRTETKSRPLIFIIESLFLCLLNPKFAALFHIFVNNNNYLLVIVYIFFLSETMFHSTLNESH